MTGSSRVDRDDEQVTVFEAPSHVAARDIVEAVAPGSALGRYVVVEQVGTGAMGQVVRAYDPKLRREVAIKRVRAGGRDDEGQARLLREARAMAQLSHPNVVSVYDVEAHDDGVALAMEYVPGGTLAQWLRAAPRPFVDILGILRKAGEGLAAAHRVELVHRDFKPANVLVADDGRAKVTDFGLAKPLGTRSDFDRLQGEALDDDGLTHAGTVMGTPRYMAPEQHAGEEADARADQYAYCVTLWEALSGIPPFSGKSFETLLDAKRRGPPAWPKTVAVPALIVAALRRGLQPDPQDRWPDMNALLSALDRWRGRARARRVIMTLAAAGVLGCTVVGIRLLERHRALEHCMAQSKEIDALWPGRTEPVRVGMLASDVPYAETTWEKVFPRLDEWAVNWRRSREDVCVASTVTHTMAHELHARAQVCLETSRVQLETVLELLAEGDPTAIRGAVSAVAAQRLEPCVDTASLERGVWPSEAQWDEVDATRRQLARVVGLQSAGRYDEGYATARTVLDHAAALGFAPLVAEARMVLGTLADHRGDYESAEQELIAAYFEAAGSGADVVAFEAATRLVFTLGHNRADVEAGLQWGEHARVAAARVGHDDAIAKARLLHSVAALHRARGALEESRSLNEQALALREQVLGREHPDVGASLNNLGLVAAEMGDFEASRRLHEQALELRERALGPDHPHVASSLDNLATVHRVMGAYEQAKALHERARVILEAALGSDHPSVATNLTMLAVLHIISDEYEEARALSLRALEIRERAFGSEHPTVAYALDTLSGAAWGLGERAEAVALRERALALREQMFGPEHPQVAATLENVASYHLATGSLDEAKAHYARALAIWEQASSPEDPTVSRPLIGLAEVALAAGRSSEAVSLAERARTVQEASDDSNEQLAAARFVLARALWNEGRDRPRAVVMARAAREEHRARGDDEARAKVEAWLAERTDGTPTP